MDTAECSYSLPLFLLVGKKTMQWDRSKLSWNKGGDWEIKGLCNGEEKGSRGRERTVPESCLHHPWHVKQPRLARCGTNQNLNSPLYLDMELLNLFLYLKRFLIPHVGGDACSIERKKTWSGKEII